MSIIAIGMNLMLAGLLTAALLMGYRLNARLKALRDSHEGFAKAVGELDAAAARAEQGLADLRAATDEAHDALADRIAKARELTAKLDRQLQGAPQVSARVEPMRGREREREDLELGDVERVTHRLGSLLSAARDPRPDRTVRRELAPVRERPRFDDDLFDIDDEPMRAGGRR
ncbi:DUF6468 domain-containing protein [Phenylobacterium sp. LH3H17]|uniref:DUF6468 domain-containing protein n=1 Tax=Phenylobacterium sp. LH3H17 TaxID=2903901 RepID=UPI0020CA2615|nr:DUF6468 domain-containing protein [Phenylobacterium sp. LH3H17]UTP40764.1 DUF6468 domain-containing protein [Phenylobacterium sp. LH3H17]